jgi:hypothetical protein
MYLMSAIRCTVCYLFSDHARPSMYSLHVSQAAIVINQRTGKLSNSR